MTLGQNTIVHPIRIIKFLAVICCIIICFYLSVLDLELKTQFVLGGILTSLLLLLIALPVSNRLEVRLVILLLGGFLACRYIAWRTTNTIVYTGMADFIPMMLLYVAEIYSFVVFVCGLIINVMPLERSSANVLNENELPFVDVLIPTFNEPPDLVKITATGCTLMDYPKNKLRISLLDDGATEARLKSQDPEISNAAKTRKKILESFCKKIGIEYRTRKNNKHAKAGNINAALSSCSGELLLILDSDHVPTRDFLKRTVSFFQKDPKLFLVQTPHFMINANPVEKNLGLFADAPSESEMFYGLIQKGLDFWNSSFFCGSAALLRRNYLQAIGGISGATVTEDAETSIELHALGLRSVYFKDPVTSGLSPETFSDFVNQRSRWAQGMIQIFLLKNPILKNGLKIYQKISYANSSIFWFFGLARFVFLIAPLLYLYFGLHIYMASVPQVLAYAFPFLIASFYISNFLFGEYRWPLFSELYETAQSIFLIPSVLSVLFNPRQPRFNVTPKGQSLLNDFLSPLGWPLVILFVTCLVAIPFSYYRWCTYPLERDVVIICTTWLIFHMILLLMCIGAVFERHQLRRHPRTWAFGNVIFKRADGSVINGQVQDLSLGGMGANVTDCSIHQGELLDVLVQDSYGNSYSLHAKVLRIGKNVNSNKIAIEFICNNIKEFSALVGYVYGDSLRWKRYQERKRKKVPMVQGIFYLLAHGLKCAFFAFKEMVGMTVNVFARF